MGTFSGMAMEDTTWTAPATTTAIQVVTLTLTVTDDNGNDDAADDLTARDSVTITVRRGAPISVENEAADVAGGASVSLLATSRSADVPGATRLWTATPNVGTFSNAAAEDTMWTAPAATAMDQVVTLTLTVTDGSGGGARASVVITVLDGPTVSIQTADQTVDGGASIRLGATSDNSGKGFTLAWVADPASPDGGTFSPSAAVEDPTWTAPTPAANQEVTLTLTAADGDATDNDAMDSVTILVAVPTRRSASRQRIRPSLEGLRLRRSTPRYLLMSLRTRGPPIPRWERSVTRLQQTRPWTAPGTTAAKQVVTLTLTVTDIDGDMASDSVTITVPSGPTVSIQTADQTVDGATVVELEATSRSADGKGITRAWTVSPAGGMFSNTTVDDVTWTAPATIPATQVFTLTLTVRPTDQATFAETGSGSASVVITVPGTDPTVSIQTEEQDVAGGTVLQLQATSADSDGTIASYAWTADPDDAGMFSDATVEDATWTAPATTAMDQVFTLTLTVTDNDMEPAMAMASVMITVLSGPAVSVETMDQSVPGGTVVNLLATSRSADVAGATRLWTATPNVGTFSNAAVEDATWTAPATTAATQVVTLTLTVTTSDGATGSASAMITVPGTDPTVSIQTADQEVAGGASILLEATSADVATYAWTATAGTFSDPTVEDATWTAPGTRAANRVVTLTLTVTDSDGATARASVTITVPGGPTVTIQTADQTVFGATVLQLQATSRDSDGSTVASYAWMAEPAVGTFSDDAAVEDPTWTAPAAMAATQVVTLTLTVTASDDDMVPGSASVTITVPGTDPTVSIQTEEQDVAGGTVLQLQATSADSHGTIASYAWTADPDDAGMFSDATAEDPTWTAPATTTANQVATLTLIVTDNNMDTAMDSVTITVPGTDPTVSIQTEDEDQTVVLGGDPIELVAMSSEDDVTGYAWTAVPAVGTFSDAAVEDATWTAPAATTDDQVVTLTLTVTDSDGVTASASVMITVPGVSGGPVLESVRVDDGPSHDGTGNDSTGNNDGIAQCEETIELYVSIRNDGELPLTGLSGELIETDPLVRLLYNASSGYPDVAAGSIEENRLDWDLRVSPDAPSGHEFSFTIRLTADEGGPWDVLVTVPIGCASPGVAVLESVRVDDGPSHDGTGNDSTGNNDGIAQCEETIELYVSIRNDGELPLTGLSGELIETDPLVRLLYNASSGYPDVAAGSIEENRFDWDLRVSPDAPSGHEFSFTIRLTADEGGPWDVLVTVPIACG